VVAVFQQMKHGTVEEGKTVQHHTGSVLLLQIQQALAICGVTFLKNIAHCKTASTKLRPYGKHDSMEMFA
jgi:hypothetical protein